MPLLNKDVISGLQPILKASLVMTIRQRIMSKSKTLQMFGSDSGSTHAFVLEAREDLQSPADLYLEGQTSIVVGSIHLC